MLMDEHVCVWYFMRFGSRWLDAYYGLYVPAY